MNSISVHTSHSGNGSNDKHVGYTEEILDCKCKFLEHKL